MEAEWIEFDEGAARPRNEIYVTLSFDGNILMNHFAFEALGSPERVVLLFDRKNRRIGIRPSTAATLNSFELKRRLPKRTRRIRARPFIKQWDLFPAHTIRFREPWIENGVLILDLAPDATVPAKASGGRRRTVEPPRRRDAE